MTFAAGARWWPWYVFSGWWVGLKGQYSDYVKTGVWRPALEEGNTYWWRAFCRIYTSGT